MAKKSPKIILQAGWVAYLRTSSKETQNPENSQARQRNAINNSLLQRSALPLLGEYTDVETGTSSERTNYQRMLEDARLGKFSHIASEEPERFGRDDVEALRAIDEMDALGIAVRFANHPDLDPTDPDQRIMVTMIFALARRESKKNGQRTRGGIHAKLRRGGHSGVAPDGYLNCHEEIMGPEKDLIGRTRNWVEHDPQQWQVWRDAWDLLLTNQYSLKEICEELHRRGYTLRTGRPFVKAAEKGRRSHATNSLSDAFNNWFYAGWVVSEPADIAPKTIRGTWQAVVTTEEFERGRQILDERKRKRYPERKHFYLLKKILYLKQGQRLFRLSGSTSNTYRPSGGNAYYCIPASNINIPCELIDLQMPKILQAIHIAPSHISQLRADYIADFKSSDQRPKDSPERLRASLKLIDAEEKRAAYNFSRGKLSELVWDELWSEWQGRRLALQQELAALEQSQSGKLANLDDAVLLLDQLSQLYDTLSADERQQVLALLIEKIVVDIDGTIVSVALHRPFAYLMGKYDEVKKRLKIKRIENATLFEGGVSLANCSEYVRLSGEDRFPTFNGCHIMAFDTGLHGVKASGY